MERLLTVLDPLAKPRPATDGVKDPRSPGQRRHDGVLDLLELTQRAELLPDIAGVSTTVILTVSAEEWANGSGLAQTGHGALIPTSEAARWAGDARHHHRRPGRSTERSSGTPTNDASSAATNASR